MKIVIAIIAAFAVTSAGANSLPLAPAKAKAVKVSVKPKGRPHLPKVLKPLIQLEVDEDNDYWEEPIAGHVSYRRPELISNDELPLSDYVNLRLANARRLAMEQYHQVWG